MEEKIYTINIGDFIVEEIVYENRCLSASFGGEGISTDTIPWEDTEYNPWDFKYENEEFILDIIEIPEPIIEPTEMERLRADVDYLLMLED